MEVWDPSLILAEDILYPIFNDLWEGYSTQEQCDL